MWFVIVPLAAIAFAVAILYAVRAASRRAEEISETTANAMAFMDDCESRVLTLVSDPANKDHSQRLNTLHEQIKFSDKTGTTEIDWKVEAVLTRLELALSSPGGEDANEVINEATALFNRRKAEIRVSKQGKF